MLQAHFSLSMECISWQAPIACWVNDLTQVVDATKTLDYAFKENGNMPQTKF